MPPVRWSQAALHDVTRLHDFLVSKSSAAAKRAIHSIRQGVKTLETHPEIGRPIDDLPPEFREWITEFGQSGYVILYRFDGRQVVLLAVRHGREAGY
ncbi:MAG: type II toxin-antitoxin system RelE/ParE family toxin [Terracidiphilus sp.]